MRCIAGCRGRMRRSHCRCARRRVGESLFDFCSAGAPAVSAPAGSTLLRRRRSASVSSARTATAATGRVPAGRVAYLRAACDGRYFPIQRIRRARRRSSSATRSARRAKTKVFSGSKIDHAVARDGSRYADLDNALRLSREDRAGLHLQRPGRVRARAARRRQAIRRCGRATSSRPTTGLTAYTGSAAGAAEFTPIGDVMDAAEMRATGLRERQVVPATPRDARSRRCRCRRRPAQQSRRGGRFSRRR